MKKVAFVCVHNSCRSQMAESFGKVLGLDVFEAYSAGTEQRPHINQDAVRLMKEVGIDMEMTQSSKLLADIPEVDIVITMGCNVNCPNLPCSHREDWDWMTRAENPMKSSALRETPSMRRSKNWLLAFAKVKSKKRSPFQNGAPFLLINGWFR